jgi:hypothetical protein
MVSQSVNPDTSEREREVYKFYTGEVREAYLARSCDPAAMAFMIIELGKARFGD